MRYSVWSRICQRHSQVMYFTAAGVTAWSLISTCDNQLTLIMSRNKLCICFTYTEVGMVGMVGSHLWLNSHCDISLHTATVARYILEFLQLPGLTSYYGPIFETLSWYESDVRCRQLDPRSHLQVAIETESELLAIKNYLLTLPCKMTEFFSLSQSQYMSNLYYCASTFDKMCMRIMTVFGMTVFGTDSFWPIQCDSCRL